MKAGPVLPKRRQATSRPARRREPRRRPTVFRPDESYEAFSRFLWMPFFSSRLLNEARRVSVTPGPACLRGGNGRRGLITRKDDGNGLSGGRSRRDVRPPPHVTRER